MKYLSTRDSALRYASAEAVKMGLSRDGGLLTPTEIPQIDQAFLEGLLTASYQERAAKVMGLYLTDYTEEELTSIAPTGQSAAHRPQELHAFPGFGIKGIVPSSL